MVMERGYEGGRLTSRVSWSSVSPAAAAPAGSRETMTGKFARSWSVGRGGFGGGGVVGGGVGPQAARKSAAEPRSSEGGRMGRVEGATLRR
jgi:hypothetical protein